MFAIDLNISAPSMQYLVTLSTRGSSSASLPHRKVGSAPTQSSSLAAEFPPSKHTFIGGKLPENFADELQGNPS